MKKIKEFQLSQDLTPDGVIGPITLNALRGKLALSKEQLANYLGQLHIETGGFEYDTERLNYSPERLMQIFSYYKNRPGEAYIDGYTTGRPADQETIANKVYWDRNRSKNYKLGNIHWGDGFKYRGRGSIMVTGKFNYGSFGNHVGANLLENPELVASVFFWDSALWYFDKKNLWEIAEEVTIESMTKITKVINGGDNGLAERMQWTRRYLYLQNR